MSNEQQYTFIENPPDDERSAEEREIAETCRILMKSKIVAIVVGAEPPGTPSRVVGVAIGVLPWNLGLFKRRHDAMVKGVQSMVEGDAKVQVLAMPMKVLWSMLVYRGLEKKKGRDGQVKGVVDVRS